MLVVLLAVSQPVTVLEVHAVTFKAPYTCSDCTWCGPQHHTAANRKVLTVLRSHFILLIDPPSACTAVIPTRSLPSARHSLRLDGRTLMKR